MTDEIVDAAAEQVPAVSASAPPTPRTSSTTPRKRNSGGTSGSPNDGQWVPDRVCECRDCGKRFQVEQGEYHFTRWKWTEVARGRRVAGTGR
ncbi:hypothetical protein [Lentzea xinjiangensis]|uniref:hypothetical protein n=1 Tax=Lentzea xinjiangensis TaxID=402600 RepID=UPI001160A9A6|nr:hypothetical protein [Lentzea xinjiangensis]